MKSAHSLMLIASVVGLATVAAQERIVAMPGPMARGVTRETVRPDVDVQSEPAASDWARVQALVPETEVIVTSKGARPGTRYMVHADESELVVKVTEHGRVETLARMNVVEISIRP